MSMIQVMNQGLICKLRFPFDTPNVCPSPSYVIAAFPKEMLYYTRLCMQLVAVITGVNRMDRQL